MGAYNGINDSNLQQRDPLDILSGIGKGLSSISGFGRRKKRRDEEDMALDDAIAARKYRQDLLDAELARENSEDFAMLNNPDKPKKQTVLDIVNQSVLKNKSAQVGIEQSKNALTSLRAQQNAKALIASGKDGSEAIDPETAQAYTEEMGKRNGTTAAGYAAGAEYGTSMNDSVAVANDSKELSTNNRFLRLYGKTNGEDGYVDANKQALLSNIKNRLTFYDTLSAGTNDVQTLALIKGVTDSYAKHKDLNAYSKQLDVILAKPMEIHKEQNDIKNAKKAVENNIIATSVDQELTANDIQETKNVDAAKTRSNFLKLNIKSARLIPQDKIVPTHNLIEEIDYAVATGNAAQFANIRDDISEFLSAWDFGGDTSGISSKIKLVGDAGLRTVVEYMDTKTLVDGIFMTKSRRELNENINMLQKKGLIDSAGKKYLTDKETSQVNLTYDSKMDNWGPSSNGAPFSSVKLSPSFQRVKFAISDSRSRDGELYESSGVDMVVNAKDESGKYITANVEELAKDPSALIGIMDTDSRIFDADSLEAKEKDFNKLLENAKNGLNGADARRVLDEVVRMYNKIPPSTIWRPVNGKDITRHSPMIAAQYMLMESMIASISVGGAKKNKGEERFKLTKMNRGLNYGTAGRRSFDWANAYDYDKIADADTAQDAADKTTRIMISQAEEKARLEARSKLKTQRDLLRKD